MASVAAAATQAPVQISQSGGGPSNRAECVLEIIPERNEQLVGGFPSRSIELSPSTRRSHRN